jgi:hypothetical protein
LSNALSTSDEGLKIVPSTVEGGGIMVNLQGRFQHSMAVVTDENGKPVGACVTDPAAAKDDPETTDEGKE